MDGDLDEAVRRADPDRWLASRFIGDRTSRADVVALYAYDRELARATLVASNPLVAEIRLTWWRDALGEIFEGRPVRLHPAAWGLAQAIQRRRLARASLEAMIEGRIEVLDKPRLDLDEAVRWADAVGGAAMLSAARILDPEAPGDAVSAVGRVWGLILLLRAGVVDGPEVRMELARTFAAARHAVRSLSAAAFPAVAHATLARGALRAAPKSTLGKQLALLWAVLRGRL